VGLLSNGGEAARGSRLIGGSRGKSWPKRRAVQIALEFVGNVEGGDVVSGVADVIVTDGLTGNIALKLMEGVSQTLLGAVRDAAMASARASWEALCCGPRFGRSGTSSTRRSRAAPTCWG